MSTRCQIHFVYDADDKAFPSIYRHSDGYPEGEHGIIATLREFFSDVVSQCRDTRFNDPEYLAAKFVVWQALRYATPDAPLDFLGLGVAYSRHGDLSYEYRVVCSGVNPPSIQWRKAPRGAWKNA